MPPKKITTQYRYSSIVIKNGSTTILVGKGLNRHKKTGLHS
jgi:hypothetical protein